MPTKDAAQTQLSLEQSTRLQAVTMLIGDLSSQESQLAVTLAKAHAITDFVLQGKLPTDEPVG